MTNFTLCIHFTNPLHFCSLFCKSWMLSSPPLPNSSYITSKQATFINSIYCSDTCRLYPVCQHPACTHLHTGHNLSIFMYASQSDLSQCTSSQQSLSSYTSPQALLFLPGCTIRLFSEENTH